MPSTSQWISRVFPFYELNRILAYYVDMDCWIIPAHQWDHWYEVRLHQRENWPIDYDHTYGKREERHDFNRASFLEVLKEKNTVCATKDGLSAFFVPIFEKDEVAGVLQAGIFLKELPTRESLLGQWRKLTGCKERDFTPEFLDYVRTYLETPFLEEEVFGALREILELYAGLLSGAVSPLLACKKTRDLSREVVTKYFPNRFWLKNAIRNNRAYPPTWWLGRIRRWEREEMGLNRLPDTVLAVKLDETADPMDGLDLLLKQWHFQKEIYKFAKGMPQIAAFPVEDGGMLFFASPDPAKDETQTQAEIMDWVGDITEFSSRLLRVKVRVGVGRCSKAGGNLSGALEEALAAVGPLKPLDDSNLLYHEN